MREEFRPAQPLASTSVTSARPRLIPLAVGCFAAGMLGVLVILGLFVFGQTDLPWWLSVATVTLMTVGFALGLVALLREARSS